MVYRGTQWHRLSAAGSSSQRADTCREGPAAIKRLSLTTTIGVTVEGEVVVSRRRRRRAGVHRPHPQGQSSPLWPQWAAVWPLVPRSRTLERPTLGSVRTFQRLVFVQSTESTVSNRVLETSLWKLSAGFGLESLETSPSFLFSPLHGGSKP